MSNKKILSSPVDVRPSRTSGSSRLPSTLFYLMMFVLMFGSVNGESDDDSTAVAPINLHGLTTITVVALTQLIMGQLLQLDWRVDALEVPNENNFPEAEPVPAALVFSKAPDLIKMIPEDFNGFDVLSNLERVEDAQLVVIGEIHNDPLMCEIGEEILRNTVKKLGGGEFQNVIVLLEGSLGDSPLMRESTIALGCFVMGVESPGYFELLGSYNEFHQRLGLSPTLTEDLMSEGRGLYTRVLHHRNEGFKAAFNEVRGLGFSIVFKVGTGHIVRDPWSMLSWITHSFPKAVIYLPKGIAHVDISLEESLKLAHFEQRRIALTGDGNMDQRHDLLQRALEISVDSLRLTHLAGILAGKGRWYEACAKLQEAIVFQPECFGAWDLYFNTATELLRDALASESSSVKLEAVLNVIPTSSAVLESALNRGQKWGYKFINLPGLTTIAKRWDHFLEVVRVKIRGRKAVEKRNQEL